MDEFKLTSELMLKAYCCGYFPMADGRACADLYWVNPEKRGVLPLDQVHIGKSLRKLLKKQDFEVTFDQDFERVLDSCAESYGKRQDTWINDDIRRVFVELFYLGYAHSVEVYQSGKLIGGLYGIALGGAFFGESMFNRAPSGAKIALIALVARLNKAGYYLLDTQFSTPFLKYFGVCDLEKNQYLKELEHALTYDVSFDKDYQVHEILDYISLTRD